jgi:hypothetical protein
MVLMIVQERNRNPVGTAGTGRAGTTSSADQDFEESGRNLMRFDIRRFGGPRSRQIIPAGFATQVLPGYSG